MKLRTEFFFPFFVCVFFGGGWVRRNSFFFNKRPPPPTSQNSLSNIYVHFNYYFSILEKQLSKSNGLCIPHNRWVFCPSDILPRFSWLVGVSTNDKHLLSNLSYELFVTMLYISDSFSMLNFWNFSHISWQIHVLILLCTYSYIQLSFTHRCFKMISCNNIKRVQKRMISCFNYLIKK